MNKHVRSENTELIGFYPEKRTRKFKWTIVNTSVELRQNVYLSSKRVKDPDPGSMFPNLWLDSQFEVIADANPNILAQQWIILPQMQKDELAYYLLHKKIKVWNRCNVVNPFQYLSSSISQVHFDWFGAESTWSAIKLYRIQPNHQLPFAVQDKIYSYSHSTQTQLSTDVFSFHFSISVLISTY